MKSIQNKFAVFILTHGRPKNIKTIETLKRCNFNGRWFLIVDNEDKALEEYKILFKEKVIVFDKKEFADRVDEGNNFDERRTITHARNACFDIAEKLGIEYFLELDDDYTAFDYRLFINDKPIVVPVKNIEKCFKNIIEFFKAFDFKSIALSQGGDFIGGLFNGKELYRFSKRKCMNSFFCSPARKYNFVGAMNEDVNTYTTLGSRGGLFLTIPFVSLTQTATQSQKSGITDMYLRYGTYCKAFTTVMMHPSSVRIAMMNSSNPRIHHTIKWVNTTPQIIDEKYKKV